MEMGIGIMVFNEEYYIEWRNRFVGSCFDERRVVGRWLYDRLEWIVGVIKEEVERENVRVNDGKLKVIIKG
nr:hypothetical protein [Bacillus pumilus]